MSDSVESYSFLSAAKHKGDLGTLAHYRVIRELGRGGMGFVFEAEDAKLKRPVALKVMNQKISSVPGSRKRFISEARSMAAVHHDNVATIFEVGESGGTPFMAMEMLHGQTLEALSKSNKKKGQQVEFDEVIRFASEIARGLAAAHARGIVHRDIKPANIWLEEGTNRIKILDFGLALASTPVDQLAGRGAVIGTPGYLSPEQARSDPLDDRSDLYSLGVVLYELCTGKLPIISKSVPEQLISILAHRPKRIDEINPEIPKPLCNAIHKLIRKEPRTRYQTAKEFEDSLDEIREACEQTTEVAQAINKLKEGLSQVAEQNLPSNLDLNLAGSPSIPVQVGANGDPSFASLDEINIPVVDPLAMDPLGAAASAGSGSGPVRAVVSRPQKQAFEKTPLQKYGPLIAVVAILLLTLPIMTFAFSGVGKSDTAYLIKPDPKQVPQPVQNNRQQNPKNSKAPNTEHQAKQIKQQTAGASSEQPPAEPSRSEKANSPQNRNPQSRQSQRKVNQDGGDHSSPSQTILKEAETTASANSNEPNLDTTKDHTSGPNPLDSSPAQGAMPPSPNKESVSAVTFNESQNEKPPMEKEVKTELPRKTVWISTADGRGADAMVKAGSTENFGENPAIGVRQRGNVETNHIYLRFDLEPVNDRITTIKNATLVMNVVGGTTPVGAELRIFGIENVGVWPETGLEWRNSPSKRNTQNSLGQLEPLVEVSIEESSVDGPKPGIVKIQGGRLDQFLQNSSETATLAITGRWENKLLQFVSRDRTGGAPPRLKLSVAQQKPPKN